MITFSPQKMMENFILNADDVTTLTQIATQGGNHSKLEWDLNRPDTWQGIQWIYANNEYYVQSISIGNLGLTGELDLSGMKQLTNVTCDNNNFTSIDVSSSLRLRYLSCRNSGIRTLNVSDCPTLTVLDCEDNYLNIDDIINYIDVILSRENSRVSFENQRLNYDLTITTPGLTCDGTSKTFVLNTIQLTTEGVLPDSVLIEVNKFDVSNVKEYMTSDTIPLNTSGVGTYSLAVSPLAIAVDEYVEILVYTDENRARLITRLIIRPATFQF